jgi:endonuclease YncB( thermonuclease family)
LLAAGVSEDREDFTSAPQRLAEGALAGPVSAMVERIVDGDTIDVRAHIWLGQSLTVRVRIDGVTHPKCGRIAPMSDASRSPHATILRGAC